MADIVVRLGTVGVKALVLLIADARARAAAAERRFSQKKNAVVAKKTKDAFGRDERGRFERVARASRAARLRRRAESCRLACVEHACSRCGR